MISNYHTSIIKTTTTHILEYTTGSLISDRETETWNELDIPPVIVTGVTYSSYATQHMHTHLLPHSNLTIHDNIDNISYFGKSFYYSWPTPLSNHSDFTTQQRESSTG